MYNGRKILTLSQLHKHMECLYTISDVFDIVSGYYSRCQDVYILHKCFIKGDYVNGTSNALKANISIEKERVAPLISPYQLRPFDKITFKSQFEDGVLLCNSAKRAPKLEDYLEVCLNKYRFTSSVTSQCMVTNKQYDCINKNKIVLTATLDGYVCAVIDLSKNSLPIMGCYGIVPLYSMVNDKLSAYWAILNSRLFSYYWQIGVKQTMNNQVRWKYNLVSSFPLPNFGRGNTAYKVIAKLADCIYLLKKERFDGVNAFMSHCFANMLNMAIYEVYFPSYVKSIKLDVLHELQNAPFMREGVSLGTIMSSVAWYMSSSNIVRQKIMLIDTRSPELLYLIHTSSNI